MKLTQLNTNAKELYFHHLISSLDLLTCQVFEIFLYDGVHKHDQLPCIQWRITCHRVGTACTAQFV